MYIYIYIINILTLYISSSFLKKKKTLTVPNTHITQFFSTTTTYIPPSLLPPFSYVHLFPFFSFFHFILIYYLGNAVNKPRTNIIKAVFSLQEGNISPI